MRKEDFVYMLKKENTKENDPVLCKIGYNVYRDDIMPGEYLIYIPHLDDEDCPVKSNSMTCGYDEEISPEECIKGFLSLVYYDLYKTCVLDESFNDPNLDDPKYKLHVCELKVSDFEKVHEIGPDDVIEDYNPDDAD